MNYVRRRTLDYVEAGGLRIARALHDFVTAEAIPGTGHRARGLLAGLRRRWCASWRRATRRCWTRRDALQQQIDAWHLRASAAPADRPGGLSGVPARDRLPAAGAGASSPIDTEQRRCRDRQHRRAAAGRAGDQRPLCAERRQCALGQPVRRAVRHRRDPGGRRRDARRRLQPGPRRAGDRTRARSPGPGRAAGRRQPCRCDALCAGSRGSCAVTLRRDGSTTGLRDPAAFVGYRGDGAGLSAVLLRHHGLHIEI